MKVLIVDTYYPQFLEEAVAAHPELAQGSYRDRHSALMACHFAEADSYSHYLGELGHEAEEIIANAGFLQRQWAREHGLRVSSTYSILYEQIKLAQPDVLYVQNIGWLDDTFLHSVREHVRLIVGQIASPLPPNRDFSEFDLILSSFPHFVRFFRNTGLPSEYFRLGFDPRVLAAIAEPKPSTGVPIVFVGGLSQAHAEGTLLLETVAQHLPLAVWGYGVEALPPRSPLRRLHKGYAWALDMYRVLSSAHVALNRHIDVAGRVANNLRLYEATGVGTCLVTDMRDNLGELFDPDREVVTYSSPEECVEKCRYLLEHEAERAAIALAGQNRTLSEHTWAHRMRELEQILQRYLKQPRQVNRSVFTLPTSPSIKAQVLTKLRRIAKNMPGKSCLRAVYQRLPKQPGLNTGVSYGHSIIARSAITESLVKGWQDPQIAPKQRQLVNAQLGRMYQGDVPLIFRVAAEAVRATTLTDGRLVEVGCSSGYYGEVLEHLLRHRVNYIGVDYSEALITLARRCYAKVPFIVGDATRLPLAAESCEVLFSGSVLLHVPDYAAVIRESARVSNQWCIFHRTPVFLQGDTICLSKFAYGVKVVELIFGEHELYQIFSQYGLRVERKFVIDTYSMKGLSNDVAMITYVCRKS